MKFLKLLQKLQTYSTHPVHKMSCVIANKNRVVSIGFNKYKTHTKSKNTHPYIHAELAAILDNKFADLNGCTAYVYREHKNGTPAISKPCNHCMQMLKIAGIKKVWYNNGDKEECLTF